MKINLCVGPVTLNTINSINEYTKINKKNLIIICSKNQIEKKTFGGGYVNNFTTENFYKYFLNLNNKFIKIARDHAGPGISDKKTKNFNIEIKNCKKSLETDIRCGFNEIHIDTSFAKHKKFELALKLYEFCQKKAKKYNTKLKYEIGVNFHGDKFNHEEFKKIVKIFGNLKDIKYITGTTGSIIKNNKQVGNFNKNTSKYISKILSKKKILVKDHNCDYLSEYEIKLRKRNGIFSFNIGPELAFSENYILYKYGNTLKNKSFLKFYNKVLKSNKWKKWCDSKSSNKNKFLSTAHYFYDDINYLNILNKHINNKEFTKDVFKEHFKIYKKFF